MLITVDGNSSQLVTLLANQDGRISLKSVASPGVGLGATPGKCCLASHCEIDRVSVNPSFELRSFPQLKSANNICKLLHILGDRLSSRASPLNPTEGTSVSQTL